MSLLHELFQGLQGLQHAGIVALLAQPVLSPLRHLGVLLGGVQLRASPLEFRRLQALLPGVLQELPPLYLGALHRGLLGKGRLLPGVIAAQPPSGQWLADPKLSKCFDHHLLYKTKKLGGRRARASGRGSSMVTRWGPTN